MKEMNLLADLMILEMSNFDVNLGIDWLASCHATLDCHNKMVKFGMPGEPAFASQGYRSDVLQNLISALGAQRLLRKGCHEFLAYVRNLEKEVMELDQVSVQGNSRMLFPRSYSVYLLIVRWSLVLISLRKPDPSPFPYIGWLRLSLRSSRSNCKIYWTRDLSSLASHHRGLRCSLSKRRMSLFSYVSITGNLIK